MSLVNITAREVAAKIVYYGPGLSGKTTTLKRIYDAVKPASRGEMLALATEGDRTLFFDFLPVKVERIRDYTLRLGLYTVPGQVFYNATRKLVLQGADGVVFVADSQPDALERNVESMENLHDNLRDQGIEAESFPLVIQYNKRDLRNALAVEKLRQVLNARGVPDFETSAAEGKGVMDALKTVTRLVIRDLKSRGVVSPESPAAPPASARAPAHSPLESGLQALEAQPASPGPAKRTFLLALAPPEVRDRVAAAEAAFEAGQHGEVIRGVTEALRAMGDAAGAQDDASRGYLLGLDGLELRRLLRLAAGEAAEKDAAFALVLLAQACLRATR